MPIKLVERARVGFPKTATILVDLNKISMSGEPSVEVYCASNWNVREGINLNILYEDKQHVLLIRLPLGGQNVVVNK